MKKFVAKIKEKGNEHVLTPIYMGSDDTTKEDLIEFWGCENDDVEWYDIKEVPLDDDD